MADAAAAVRDRLSPRQRKVWECATRVIRLLCGRQAGKTFLAVAWLLVGALLVPQSTSVYLALTKESAKEIAWAEFVLVGTTILELDAECFKEHGMIVKLPNGSRILVRGTDDRRTVESWRGTKLFRIVIDEMGAQQPDLIEYFISQILWPALMRHDGSLMLCGTPGLIAEGFWWARTRPEVQLEEGFFGWTVFENPAIPNAEAFIEDTLPIFGWTRETPQYLREYLAKWVDDPAALVYPYDKGINLIEALPKFNGAGVPITAWSYVIGQSIATLDTSAWVVWAWAPQWPGAILTRAEVELLDPYDAAERTRELQAQHPGCDHVLDVGDLGAAHAEVARRRHELGAIAADRNDRPSAIRDLRGGLQAGKVKLLEHECEQLRDQWRVLGWDAKKRLHAPGQPDALASAALYGYGRVPPHSRNLELPKSKSRQEQFLDDIERQLVRDGRRKHAGRFGVRRLER